MLPMGQAPCSAVHRYYLTQGFATTLAQKDTIILLILQVRKLRLRVVKELAPGLVVTEWWSQSFNPSVPPDHWLRGPGSKDCLIQLDHGGSWSWEQLVGEAPVFCLFAPTLPPCMGKSCDTDFFPISDEEMRTPTQDWG